MTEQTPSGNRWEPADAQPVDPATPADPAYAAQTPPPAPADPERPSRWRALLRRPSRETWVAGALSALMVFVGLGGFLAGRASVDEQPGPAEVGQEWRHGPQDGDLPDRPFDDGDGDGDGFGPGAVPGTES
ncbi:hypothetical protein [Nocardioides sp.]|uniref:hypothetical protein n=1 Tax=Nocardioides sp. TaxID=35761 RepID=UPI002ED96E7B